MKTVYSMSLLVALFLFASTTPAVASPKVNKDKDGLALKGYDPVAYFTAGAATEGKSQYSHTHRGVTYHFASADNRRQFKAKPDAYLPQYGGFCSWAASRGYLAPTDPTAWKIVKGKLYLNYSHDVKAEWEKDIPGNIAKADANWPELSRSSNAHLN